MLPPHPLHGLGGKQPAHIGSNCHECSSLIASVPLLQLSSILTLCSRYDLATLLLALSAQPALARQRGRMRRNSFHSHQDRGWTVLRITTEQIILFSHLSDHLRRWPEKVHAESAGVSESRMQFGPLFDDVLTLGQHRKKTKPRGTHNRWTVRPTFSRHRRSPPVSLTTEELHQPNPRILRPLPVVALRVNPYHGVFNTLLTAKIIHRLPTVCPGVLSIIIDDDIAPDR